MKRNISILGSGSMGVAVAVLLSKNGHNVKLWSPFEEEVAMINHSRELKNRLSGVKIPEDVGCTNDLEEAVIHSELIVMAVPSKTMRENAKAISKYIKDDKVILSCSKGLEDESCLIMSDVLCQELPNVHIAALSGPSYAIEIAKGMPTAVVAASEQKGTAKYVQDIFMSPTFRVYTNSDVRGVELGGALKNVIAISAGISDGLGFGDDTKAALLTRGIAEIARLGVAMGARSETFSGLTGIGDLILTCTGAHSRNRHAGILIGQGKSVKEALEEVNMVVEGVVTTKPAYELSKKMNVSMPITSEAYEVLFNGKNPKQAVVDLMTRDKRHEMEEDVMSDNW